MHYLTCTVKRIILAKAAPKAKELPYKDFADVLRELAKKQAGITKASVLGRLVGAHRNTAAQWWRGENLPSGREMAWLIVALGLTVPEVERLCGPPPGYGEVLARRARALTGGTVISAFQRTTVAESRKGKKPPDEGS